MIARAWVLRAIVSAAILIALLAVLPLDELWQALRRVDPPILAAVVAAFLAGHVVSALKWRSLLPGGGRVPLAGWIRAHFAGLVGNLCLPTIVGGDVIRAGWVMRQADRPEAVGVVSLADRLLDVTALGLLVLGFGWHAEALVGERRQALATLGALLIAGGAGGVGASMALRRLRPALAARLGSAVRMLMMEPWRLALGLAGAVVVQASFVLLNAWLGASIGIPASVDAWFVAWPLAKLAGLLPVSVGGIGVREAALVALMRPFGAPGASVLAVGLLWEAVLVIGGLVGLGLTSTLRVPASDIQRERSAR